jgi:exodeoxyribonuclease VII small subunit
MSLDLPGGMDIGALSYEESRDALVAVVSALEQGGTSLEDALALWERGEALAVRCQQWLDAARTRITAAAGGGQESADGED